MARELAPDELWNQIGTLFPQHVQSPKGGRKPINDQTVFTSLLPQNGYWLAERADRNGAKLTHHSDSVRGAGLSTGGDFSDQSVWPAYARAVAALSVRRGWSSQSRANDQVSGNQRRSRLGREIRQSGVANSLGTLTSTMWTSRSGRRSASGPDHCACRGARRLWCVVIAVLYVAWDDRRPSQLCRDRDVFLSEAAEDVQ